MYRQQQIKMRVTLVRHTGIRRAGLLLFLQKERNSRYHRRRAVLDFRVPVSYSRTIIVFVGIRYKHLRVHDEHSESLYT